MKRVEIIKLTLTGAPDNGFPLNALKTLFRLSRVLLELKKYIFFVAIKFISVRSSLCNLSLFEITRVSVLFTRKFEMQFIVFRK